MSFSRTQKKPRTGNPWIFARKDRLGLTLPEIAGAIRLHLQEMIAYYGNPDGLILFRKHLKRYFAGMAVRPIMAVMLQTDDLNTFNDLLRELETAVAPHHTVNELMKFPPQAWAFHQRFARPALVN